jgi:hypothetical protein
MESKIVQIAGDGKYLYGLKEDGTLVRLEYQMNGSRWMTLIRKEKDDATN